VIIQGSLFNLKMKKFRLILITENQINLAKGQKFAEMIRKTLNLEGEYEISKYGKFEDSYRVEFNGQFSKEKNAIAESIELTDRLSSPWTVTYERAENQVELIFNKSDFSTFRKIEFNVLRWAEFRFENE